MNFWLDVYERRGDKRALGIIKVRKKFQFHTFCRDQSAETIRNSHVVASVQRLWNLWLPVSALEQNYRLGLGTRLRLPLLVNTIARDILYIDKWRKVCVWNNVVRFSFVKVREA